MEVDVLEDGYSPQNHFDAMDGRRERGQILHVRDSNYSRCGSSSGYY